MHRELRLLSEREAVKAGPTVRRVVSRLPEAFPLQSHPCTAEAFAAEIERSLEGGVLRYSKRARLLRVARKLGIGRFEANLIIATVQHRRRRVDAVTIEGETGKSGEHWWQAVMVFVAAQSLIVLAAWWMLLR